MINLMKLELKKFKFKGYIKKALIIDLVILAIFYFVSIITKIEGDKNFSEYEAIFMFMSSCINVTFVVFSGFLVSKFIIGEYKSKNIYVLFSYPVSRKKIILSKMLIIIMFTFSAILLSTIVIFFIFYITQMIYPWVSDTLTLDFILRKFITTVFYATTNSLFCFIPLYFGFKKKSSQTTMVTSFLIVGLLNSSANGVSLSKYSIIPVIFAALSMILGYLVIKDIEVKDVTV